MRVGRNPYNKKELASSALHRIITAVFIPDLDDPYFKQSLEVLKMSLDSLSKTRHDRALLTVVNNGSCSAVTDYLQQQFVAGVIDQLVHHSTNLGKIDAVVPIAKSCQEPLITITDSDVLFLGGWMQAVETVFAKIPQAGMVSPVPHGTTFANHTVNTLFDAFFQRKLGFRSAANPEAMLKFAESIGQSESMYKNELRLKYQMTVKAKDCTAVVGCGHFVATYRNEVFKNSPNTWSRLAYAPEADRDYLDIPVERSKLWRLATTQNFAYHMGNTPLEWMESELDGIKPTKVDAIAPLPIRRWSLIPFGLKKMVIRLLLSKYFRATWFRFLGLKEGANRY